MWVIHVATYTRGFSTCGHLTSNTMVKCLNASLSNFTSSRNVVANLIASLTKCYTLTKLWDILFACATEIICGFIGKLYIVYTVPNFGG